MSNGNTHDSFDYSALPRSPVRLIEFLREEMRRTNLSQSQLSRTIGLNPGAISEIMNGQPPGLKASIALAQHFRKPLVEILVMAGHVPPEDDEAEYDAATKELLALVEELEPEQRDWLIKMLRGLIVR